MNRETFEIRLNGAADAVRPACGPGMTVVWIPPQTMLTTAPVDQAGLHELLRRLTDFGIELLELGPAAGADAAPSVTKAAAVHTGVGVLSEVGDAGGRVEVRGPGRVSYEIRVGGAPSPAVLAALHQRATTVPGHLVVVAEAEAGSLVDVLRALTVPGVEVESVRVTGTGVAGTDARADLAGGSAAPRRGEAGARGDHPVTSR
ncbi:hypothetical protein [Georgenia thermotolerans]|uniref:Uncharacterized protein n=1 Tax=Georgenia thermotolerans TaxID=527326 RepID=A0A7J5UMQ4_9MICO|nr:hypothetical protein [Georgenia thermotolerans]KAE8763652.1 hypothetical protein GB883_13110 [Georgenia thermotolerans]